MAKATVPYADNKVTFIVLLTFGIAFCISRTILRWRKLHTVQVEDVLVWTALSMYITFISLYMVLFPVFEKVRAVETGKMPPYATIIEDATFLLKYLFASQLLFWGTLWAIKLSLLFWFRRLTIGLPRYVMLWRIIAGFTGLAFVACVITQFTSCRSVHAWLTPGECDTARDDAASLISVYFVLAMDILTDFLIMVIPIRLLWNLQINVAEKISIGVVFSAGILTMIFAILRVVMYMVLGGDMTILALFSVVESFIAIVVGCLPAFAVFLHSKRFNSKAQAERSNSNGIRTIGGSKSKSRARTESILLDDVEVESMPNLDKNASSMDGSRRSSPQRHVAEEDDRRIGFGV